MLSDRDKIITALITRGAILTATHQADTLRYMIPGSISVVQVDAAGEVSVQAHGTGAAMGLGLRTMLLQEYDAYMAKQAKRIPASPS